MLRDVEYKLLKVLKSTVTQVSFEYTNSFTIKKSLVKGIIRRLLLLFYNK